ncbi:histidine phosphatase family protein [Brevibacillus ginsengisoli]|uniref:histidine phosphatase family protein n=1 Tax=Brevibacillus ginsengisoli TaxID=363854 RepID=UPI003CEF9018
MSFGSWEGMSYEEIMRSCPEEYVNSWSKPHLYRPIKTASCPSRDREGYTRALDYRDCCSDCLP